MTRKTSLLLALASGSLIASATAEKARYVRIELPGNSRTLTLAEVEVISGGRNIAPKGKPTQSTTSNSGPAMRATDGNKNPSYGAGGQTHTIEGRKNPWWELDFGRVGPIDEIGIWNRGDGLENRLEGFTLSLLDGDRKPVYKKEGMRAPSSSVHINLKTKKVRYDGEADIKDVPGDYRDPEFAFQKGDTIAIMGNGLADRMQHDGWTETLLQEEHRDLGLSFRNLSLTGDRVNKFPRSKGFTPHDKYLSHIKADMIFAFFGYNESFDMKPEDYTSKLEEFVRRYRGLQPNGESIPRIVLFSPIAHEDTGNRNLPNGKSNNKRLAALTEATKAAAEKSGVTFVDLFNPTKALYAKHTEPLTINGIHLTELGNKLVGEAIASALTGKEVTASGNSEPLREAVLEKNWHWHNRYRAIDGNDVWGGRSGLKFTDGQSNADVLRHELTMWDTMTANRDNMVWARAKGGDFKVDDGNVAKPVPVKTNIGGKSRSSNAGKEGIVKDGDALYRSPQETMKGFVLADGYEVNLFASNESFGGKGPINPVQLQVDTKGRLWAAVWPTYPKWEPLKEMDDALMIYHDDNKDGVADRQTEFAKVHSPLGFEFWNGGVIVASQPDILFLKDTDGDDIADVRYVLFQGIGSSDTHHTANNLIYGPDGAIYWQSGVFLVHNHEHPWGPSLNMGNSAMYRFDPRAYTIAFHANNSPNPHGISFDYWGYHYANDGTGGRSFQVRPDGKGFKMHELLRKEVRPVAADEIVSSEHFPDDIQQNFLVCNTIGYLGLKNYKLHRDGYEGRKAGEVWGTPAPELIKSHSDPKIGDKNFRPTDAIFGEDGALYIADWHNVIIGHMQHNVRDPNRDHNHGRIYRMTYKGRPLQKPVKIDGQPIAALLKNLEHPVNGVRHRTRVELSERNTDEVLAETEKWMKQWDPKNEDHAHHLLEALWLHQQHNTRNDTLLETVLDSPVEHARIAANTVKHHWYVADPRIGSVVVEEEEAVEITPGGVIADNADLTELRVNTVTEKMKYDVTELSVKAGKNVKLTFVNPDYTPHNLVIVKPGTGTAVGNLALVMGAEGFAKQFLPESDDILHSTNMLNRGESAVLEFTAPTQPGDYEYVCTFPGHTQLMRGVLKVTP